MGILRKFNEYFYSDTEKEGEMGLEPNEPEMKMFGGEEEEAGDYHGSIGMEKIAKALGEKASECDRESDKVAIIRSIVVGFNFITCLFIILGILRHW